MGELAVILPVVLAVLLGIIDLGRLVTVHQALNDLSREAANLVSRGASIASAVAAVRAADDGPVDVEANGVVIISTLQRRSAGDSTPWVVDQFRTGAVAGATSRVGRVGGPAQVPNVESLEPGVTIMAVELAHTFAPLFPVDAFGLDVYPEVIYEAAFF
jgi:hypothetical protein